MVPSSMVGDKLGILIWIAATALDMCKALLVTVMDTWDWSLPRLAKLTDPTLNISDSVKLVSWSYKYK